MNTQPLARPLEGEQLLETSPRLAPEVAVAWRRRLNFWTGRALTADALETEQDHRSGHLAAAGGRTTPGVVRGLGVSLLRERPQTAALELAGASIQVAPGLGITASGEHVLVPRPLRVSLADLAWVIFNEDGTPRPFDVEHRLPAWAFLKDDGTPRDVDLQARPFEFALGDEPIPAAALPWVAVLVLQPAEVQVVFGQPEDSPCEIDPQADAFADPRRIECARFRLCVLPRSLLPTLTAAGAANHNATWRNRVAYRLFDVEAGRRRKLEAADARFAGTIAPWELIGVPLGLLSFEPDPTEPTSTAGLRIFLDRASVVRPGGWPLVRPRPGLAADAGTPALWLARARQFAEQLGELPFHQSPDAASIAQHFRFLPPAGLLPRAALELLTTDDARAFRPPAPARPSDRAGESDFFPASWHHATELGSAVHAAPIPRDELDATLASSAPLAPYDLANASPDSVRFLVPVPQSEFEPDLLVVQEPDDRVRQELDRLIDVRQDWLGRRLKVRERHNRALRLLSGQGIVYPEPKNDPDRTDEDELRPPLGVGLLAPVYRTPAEIREVSSFATDVTPPGNPTVGPAHTPRLWLYVDRESPPEAIRVIFERLEGTGVARTVAESRAIWWGPAGLDPHWGTTVTREQPEYRIGTIPEAGVWRLATVNLTGSGFTAMPFNRVHYEVLRGRIAVMTPQLEILEGASRRSFPVTAVPGDWSSVPDGPAEAPMEESYEPTFPDSTRLDDRIQELEREFSYGSLMSTQDISNFTALVEKLKDEDSVLAQNFLVRWPGGSVPDASPAALVAGLNSIIAGELLYDQDAFAGVSLRPETRELLVPTPHGETLRRLNRLLIEDAFPDEVRRTAFYQTGPPVADVDGLAAVVQRLEDEADRADDFVDLNFTRVQADLYRVRKFVLGQTAAQKLLINPALATIAEQQTATASADQLTTFVSAARQRTAKGSDLLTALIPKRVAPRAMPEARPAVAERFIPAALLKANLQVASRISGGTQAARNQKEEIVSKLPTPGAVLPPRGLTISERFAEPPATEGLAYARAALEQVVADLPKLALRLVGERIPATARPDPKAAITYVDLIRLQGFDPTTGAPLDSAARASELDRLFNFPALALDPNKDFDEAEVTKAALDLTEIKTAILRGIERVIGRRRQLIARAYETLEIVTATTQAATDRLATLEAKVAESRHDVKVARALWQEEQERTDKINDRRDAVIARVPVLAYVRPREIDTAIRNTVSAPLDLAEALPPVPACLQRHAEPPEELSEYVRLFQQAPARWFTDLAPRLKELDTPDKCRRLLESAKSRASRYAEDAAPSAVIARTPPAIATAYEGRSRVFEGQRLQTARLELFSAGELSWARHQELAAEHATLGDLIEARHGDAGLAQAASRQIEHLRDVATCLHAEFARVSPALRLAWTERFSQFDTGARLRNLTALPRWGELDRTTRRRFQDFVSYLFARVNEEDDGAFELINDLVRLALLLASHAPVTQLIAGHVPRPAPAIVGGLVQVKPFDPSLVRAGMEVVIWDKAAAGREPIVVARAKVEDLRGAEAAIRLHQVGSTITSLTPAMQVQFITGAAKRIAVK